MHLFIHRLFKTVFKIIELFFPALAGKWAVNLFFTPLRFQRPHREHAFMINAQSSRVSFSPPVKEMYDLDWAKGRVLNKNFNDVTPKTYYRVYELGEGPAVMLVHGWSGRASQMGSIAHALASAGFKTVLFDAFAHGESPGKQTTVLEFMEIIKDVGRRFGPFTAIIGHSLGGIAAGKAITQGLETEKLVTIGSPTTMQFILEAFCSMINASGRTLNYIKEFVECYAKGKASEFSLSHLGHSLNIDGLIIHDRDDKETAYEQSTYLDKSWKRGRHIETNGLGHVRILRDKEVIGLITRFIKGEQDEALYINKKAV